MRSFRRITSFGKYIPEIDGLRLVAIASVVLYHLSGFLQSANAAIAHGYRGVNLFYAISGFVLALPFALHSFAGAQPVRIRAYFLRRLTRLEPPYILSLLLCSALLLTTHRESLPSLLPHLGASLLYLHNLIYGDQSTINPIAWTLEVEVQFYCLMPLLAVIFSVRSTMARRLTLGLAILLAGIAQVTFWDAPARARISILFAIQFFLAGLLLADLYVVDWRQRPPANWRWDLISCACWPVVFLMPDRLGWVFFPFLILLLYSAAFRGALFRRLFRNPLVTVIGGMCYTIYLLHYRLVELMVKGSGTALEKALLYLLVLAVASSAYFLLVERPCMEKDWPRRLAARVRSLRPQTG